MNESKGAHKLKDQIDEVQSSIPVTSGMKAKEIGVLLIVVIAAFIIYALFT